MQEIRDLQQMDAPYLKQGEGKHSIKRTSREQRELRLKTQGGAVEDVVES